MIKRALEEWRRQRNSAAAVSPPPGLSTQPVPSALSANSAPDANARTAALEAKLQLQEQQLAQLTDAMKTKDDQLSKYEKWYKTLKAGAKAKQRSQGGASGGASPSMTGSDSFGGATLPRDSFTSSSSFHSHQSGLGGYSSSGSVGVNEDTLNGGRPPAHPTRRAL